jgi:hypothetical protein
MDKSDIICIDFSKFNNFIEFSVFLDKNPKFMNVYTKDNETDPISYELSFRKLDKIWILNNLVIYLKQKDSDEILLNPEFEKMVLTKSIDIKNYVNKNTKTKKDKIILDIDSILDKINKVGVGGLTNEEKEFLDKQN